MLKEIASFAKNSLRHVETHVTHRKVVDESLSVESRLEMHGRLADPAWEKPRRVTDCDMPARPGYDSREAHEYLDTPEVLDAKTKRLAELLTQSKAAVVYSGAGISTGAGINDYATRTGIGSVSGEAMSPLEARPTKAHLAITALHSAGLVKQWIQQNHDGLPQKAGFPQAALNEIHGAWFDPSNPVVKMSGQLRADLFQQLLDWEQKADLCLTVGSSVCGMNADRICTTVAQKQQKKEKGALGLVIVNLQKTRLDRDCALRIFATIDEVMDRVLSHLALQLPCPPDYRCFTEHVFTVPYNPETGEYDANCHTTLDLRVDSQIKITQGPYTGCVGAITGSNREGHYRLTVRVMVKPPSFTAPTPLTLGRWWVLEAVKGSLQRIPLVNIAPDSNS